MQFQTRFQRGFTLVELSIVLVIIGLLTGGIVAGRHLVRSSKIQSMITDLTAFQSAISSFQSKYQALPGDFATATTLWGAQPNCNGNSTTAGGTPPQTCNGNGDGIIGGSDNFNNIYETFLAWQHLSNAGMVMGNFSGAPGPGGASNAVPGVNVPTSRVASNVGYWINHAIAPPSAGWFTIPYGHFIEVGAQDSTLETYQPFLTGAEAYSFDLKNDDGMPGSGTIVSSNGTGSCYTTNVPATSTYITSGTNLTCNIVYKIPN